MFHVKQRDNDGKEVPIEARFNPELTERSDLSKIAFGNRKRKSPRRCTFGGYR